MDEAETLIDYVLVYAEKSKLDFAIPKRIGIEKYSVQEKLEMRRGFLEHLQKEGKLEIVDQPVIETDGEMLTYVLIRAPFEVLCKEAERVKLRMPLAIVSIDFIDFFNLLFNSTSIYLRDTPSIERNFLTK